MLQAVLLDISGVLHEDGVALPGAVEAVARLQSSRLALRFVTNTSRKTGAVVETELRQMGFALERQQVFTAPAAVRRYLEQHRLRPYLLIHEHLEPEFEGLNGADPDAVVLCDAEHRLNYQHLDEAFQVLLQGAPLLTVGTNRYFQQRGGLHLDVGPFVKALEYAADTQAVVLGKPAPGFFRAVLEDIGVEAADALMVGDDVEADVAAAMDIGMRGALVQAGKYRAGDEVRAPGASLEASLAELVARLL
jgi:HAD superfamily hydrolase (TIGR01458 family)